MKEGLLTTWLVGGSVVDVRSGRTARVDVAIAGGRVAELADRATMHPQDTVVDVTGLFLLPGLIDCHVHLVMRGEDPDPSANVSRPDQEIRDYAAGAAERTLLAGVTSVRDVGGWNYVEMAVRDQIANGARVGPRLFLAGRLLSMPTEAVEYYPGMYEVATGPEAVGLAARNQLDRGADMIKVMATGAMLSPVGEDARATQFSVEEIRAAVDAAREAGTHVAAHAHALEGVRNAVLAGVRSIEHGTYADEDVLRLMAEGDVFLVPTFSPWTSAREDRAVVDAMPQHIRARLSEAHQTHADMVRSAAGLRVPIAMGTDAGTPGNHHGANALECVALVEEAGLSPQASIRAATLDAARLLRREHELGSIEPGKLADIVGVRSNPLEDVRAMTEVAFVMKGGTIVKQIAG